MMDICPSCHMAYPEQDVPRSDDDLAWTRLAKHHYPNCDWVITRAHTCIFSKPGVRCLRTASGQVQIWVDGKLFQTGVSTWFSVYKGTYTTFSGFSMTKDEFERLQAALDS